MGKPLPLSPALKLFGRRVANLRASLKMTQEELAYRMDVDVTYISKIENGHRNITIDKIFKLANALNISPRDLF